jgi:hypothetical protein
MMHAHPGSRVVAPVLGAVLLALVLVVVWAAMPEAAVLPILVLVAAAEITLYGVLYLIQRRRRW